MTSHIAKRWVLLVLACSTAGALAALSLSRFSFLGYGMAAPALAGVLAGMLALSYYAAIPAGLMAAFLSLLMLGLDRFAKLYDSPLDSGVVVLLVAFWVLSGGFGGFIGARAFQRWGFRSTAVVLAMVLALFLATTHAESSYMTALAAKEPPDKAYTVDGALYLKTFYLMKQGEGFYDAFRIAFKQDRDTDIPGTPDHPAQYFNYRLPTLHQLWAWTLPAKGDYILSLLILLETVALLSAFLMVHKWTGGPIALLAPILLAPHYSLFAREWAFDFSELWSALLLVIVGLLFVSGRRVYAVVVVTLVLAIRELFFFAPLAGMAASFLSGRGRHVILWLAPIAVFFGLEAYQYSQIAPYLTVAGERTFTDWLLEGGASYAVNTVRFATSGVSTNDVIAGALLVLAIAGLFSVPTREHKAFFGVLLVTPLLSFFFIGHAGGMGNAYWGFVYSSTLLILVPMSFNLVFSPLHRKGNFPLDEGSVQAVQ
ncbi:MAG: hypothetical protein HYX94_04810 [Chloroflexi bacterium]|nr:hypothetical protein [Chloroflexota bacterium]